LRKKSFFALLVLLLTFLGLYEYKNYYMSTFRSKIPTSELQSKTSIVPMTTNIGKNNVGQDIKLRSLNTVLAKQKFIGVYVTVNGKNIINSKSYGYANSGKKVYFDYSTLLRSTSIEKMMNFSILLNEIKVHNLTTNSNLIGYVPELKKLKKITIADLVENKQNLSVDLGSIKNENENTAILNYFKNLKVNKDSSSREKKQNAINMLIVILIRRLDRVSYSHAVNTFSQKYDLSNVEVFSNDSILNHNDAISYYSSKDTNGNPQQNKPINPNNANYSYGIDQIRLSILDIINYLSLINKRNYLPNKDKYLLDVYMNSQSNIKIKDNGNLVLKWDGFRVSVLTRNKAEKEVVIIENYPNSKLFGLNLAKKVMDISF